MKEKPEDFDRMMDELIRDWKRASDENILLRRYLEELCDENCPNDYKRVVYNEIFKQ